MASASYLEEIANLRESDLDEVSGARFGDEREEESGQHLLVNRCVTATGEIDERSASGRPAPLKVVRLPRRTYHESGVRFAEPVEEAGTSDHQSLPPIGIETIEADGRPLNFLTKTDASALKGNELLRLKYCYKFPSGVEVKAATFYQRVDWDVPGWVAMYEAPFKLGLRFPLPTLVRDVLRYFRIAPTQLMPNGWRLLLAVECLSERLGRPFGYRELLNCYYLKEHPGDPGRYTFNLFRKKQGHPVLNLTTADRGWKPYFFWVRGEMVFGPGGSDGVPLSWKKASKYSILFISFAID
ncbi:uncharacterized protein LOC120000070 [Tripterygium wilfordii]|uniref:uncharacterized protein LOC120000070 n=1 Tax=Tripterygium wilfordii TaxID=458696 RepID=UPI0018F84E89|nr:uncharacterized protein LOC120000070 [Tripterygium wilfordii]